jgi:hypothetical protein
LAQDLDLQGLAFVPAGEDGAGQGQVTLFFVFHQAERELLLETGGTEVRHVDWHMGQVAGGFLSWFAQGFMCQVRYIPVEAALQSEQILPVVFEFGSGHRHPPMKAPASVPPHLTVSRCRKPVKQFDKEVGLIGEKGFEKTIDQGAAIEKQLGIYYPPKSPRNDSLPGAVSAAAEFLVQTMSNARLVVTGAPRRLPDWLGGSPRAPKCSWAGTPSRAVQSKLSVSDEAGGLVDPTVNP